MGRREAAMNLANVRRELRYSPLAGGVFNIRIRALSFGVLDISASAVHLDCDPAKLPRADSVQLSWVANTTLDMEGRAISGEQGLRLTLLDHHIEQRAVLYFDPSNRELLLRALHQLREMRLLQENDDSAMQTRVPKHSDIEKALNELQLDERAKGDWKVNIEKWIESNSLPIARMGPHAWPLTLRTLGETLSTFHVRENRFERYLGDLLDVVVKENRPRRIHAVPMRPLRDLSMLLNRYKSKFDSKDIKWHPSLWEFLGLSWKNVRMRINV